jgi:hypothetical protein
MAKQGSDAWICTACRSINPKRTSACYRCHAPRELTGATPETLPTVGGSILPPALHPYRPSHGRAVLVVVAMVLAYLATSVVALWSYPETFASELSAQVKVALPDPREVWISWLIAVVFLVGAWAAWISRVVDNQPALGLGYPRVTPRWAVIESFFPGTNLITAVARIREAILSLDPRGHGVGYVNLAVLLALTPWGLLALYMRFGHWIVGLEAIDRQLHVILPALWILSFSGVAFIAMAIARIELLSRARSRWVEVAGIPS